MTSYRKSLIFVLTSLCIFTLIRFANLILYLDQYLILGSVTILKGFIEGVRFDLASTLVYLGIPLLLMNIPLQIIQNRYIQPVISWFIFAIVLVGIAILFSDLVYFDFVKRHLAHELLFMEGGDYMDVTSLVFGPYIWYFLMSLVVAVVVAVLWSRVISSPLASRKFSFKSFAIYIVSILLIVIGGRGGIGDKPITIIDAFSSGSTPYSNLVLNGVFSMSHSMLKAEKVNHHFFDEKKALEILDHNPVDKQYPFQLEHKGKKQTQFNLVIILVESLSYKYVDAFAGLNYGVTKNLDNLAKNGLVLTNFYAAGQRSVEGIQATLTGIPSIIGLPTIGIGLLANYSKLGNIGAQNGYETIFVQSSKRRSLRVDAIAGSAGFKQYYGKEDMPILLDYPDPTAVKYGWDYETLMFAADKMEKANKPFISFVLTGTTHTPYPKLPKNLEKFPHNSNSEQGFLNTVNYMDWSVGKFMERVKEQPWFDRTLFVITADHALAHYQSGDFIERFKIPLIIYAPEIVKPGVIGFTASQLDLFPTIIDLLGLNATYSTFGTSIFKSRQESYALVREGAVMGLISNHGYVRHTLRNRLETKLYKEELAEPYVKKLEEKLLALDQLSYELLQSNRWLE